MQKGDKVVMKHTRRTGVVVSVGQTQSRVYLDTQGGSCLFDNEVIEVVEPVFLPREISFDEVQVGDKIRTTASLGALGTVLTTTGTVGRLSGKEAVTTDHQLIFVAGNTTYSDWKIELLERPEPVKVNPFTEAGIWSVATRSGPLLWIKVSENAWRSVYKDGSYVGTHATYTDEVMEKGSHEAGGVSLTFKA